MCRMPNPASRAVMRPAVAFSQATAGRCSASAMLPTSQLSSTTSARPGDSSLLIHASTHVHCSTAWASSPERRATRAISRRSRATCGVSRPAIAASRARSKANARSVSPRRARIFAQSSAISAATNLSSNEARSERSNAEATALFARSNSSVLGRRAPVMPNMSNVASSA